MQDPILPPLLSGSSVSGAVRPFDEACRLAEVAERGAGDVIWSRNTEAADCAIILEPDVPLARCQQLVPMTMVAMSEALAMLCPPKVAVEFRWPGDIMINGAKGGDVRLAAAACASEAVPTWIVIAMRLQLVHGDKDFEPGERLDITCLAEEGAGGRSRSEVIGSACSHWMARLNRWQEDGFRALHDQWLYRAVGRDEVMTMSYAGEDVAGRVMGLDDEAGLILRNDDQSLRILSFAPFIMHLNDAGELA